MNTPECGTHYVTSIRTHNSQRTEHKYICIPIKFFFSLIHRDALPEILANIAKSPLPVDLLRVRLGTTWSKKQKWRFARVNEKL